jgi:hypothetical protein
MALRNIKKHSWNGARIDTGAQRTVIGLAQARAYCKLLGIPFTLSISTRVFVFAVDRRNSLGILHMRLPTPNGSLIMLEVDVMPPNAPMLLGLDVLDKFGLTADTVHNVLHCTAKGLEPSTGARARARGTSNSPLQIESFTRSQSCRSCIAIFQTHRRKTFSHYSSVQRPTTWMSAHEQCLAISTIPVAPANATVRHHSASKLNFPAELSFIASSRWT